MVRNMHIMQTTILARCHLHPNVSLIQNTVRPRRFPLVGEEFWKVTWPVLFQLLHHLLELNFWICRSGWRWSSVLPTKSPEWSFEGESTRLSSEASPVPSGEQCPGPVWSNRSDCARSWCGRTGCGNLGLPSESRNCRVACCPLSSEGVRFTILKY